MSKPFVPDPTLSSEPHDGGGGATAAGEGAAPQSRPAEHCAVPSREAEVAPPREIGGRDGPEPTRFGDWEKAGRCIDF